MLRRIAYSFLLSVMGSTAICCQYSFCAEWFTCIFWAEFRVVGVVDG